MVKRWTYKNRIQHIMKKNQLLQNELFDVYKVYIDELPGMLRKCNNTVHWSIKMKPVNVKFHTYVSFPVKFNT